MKRYFVTALAAVPLFFLPSNAGQSKAPQAQLTPAQVVIQAPQQDYMGWPGDEAGTGSYLGVDVTDVTSDRMSALKLKEEKGVEVTMVDQDAPAGKAGIKEHDVIMSVNGTAIDSAAQLRRVIHETPAGRTISLVVSRDGQQMTLKAQLADRNKNAYIWSPKAKDFTVNVTPMPPMPALPEFDFPAMVTVRSSARNGLMVENITAQLGEFFGVKEGKGVLVRSVEKGSRAEQAGLKAGDVIVRINDQPVHDTTDFSYAMRRAKENKSVGLVVMREKREQNLTMQQPEVKDSSELMEETFDDPEVDLSVLEDDQLADAQNLLAQMQPKIELASREASQAAERALQSVEQATKSGCRQDKITAHEQAIATQKAQMQAQEQMLQAERSQQKIAARSQATAEKAQKQAQQEMREVERNLRRELRGGLEI